MRMTTIFTVIEDVSAVGTVVRYNRTYDCTAWRRLDKPVYTLDFLHGIVSRYGYELYLTQILRIAHHAYTDVDR